MPILLIIAAGTASSIVTAQSDMMFFQSKVPQAQSRQELDSFLDLVQVSEPKEILALVRHFRERFPRSEFLAQTYRIEMKAHKELEEHQRAIDAGEQALTLNPEDLETLLALADILSDRISKPGAAAEILSKGEHYARRALDEISSLKAPRTIPPRDWQRLTAQMKASAHRALGLIALKRGHYSTSIAEFELCTSQNPDSDGTQYYMLGLAYLFNGNQAQAKIAFMQASKLGPQIVKARAEVELATLEQKQKTVTQPK